jgi:hypothetical protein
MFFTSGTESEMVKTDPQDGVLMGRIIDVSLVISCSILLVFCSFVLFKCIQRQRARRDGGDELSLSLQGETAADQPQILPRGMDHLYQ